MSQRRDPNFDALNLIKDLGSLISMVLRDPSFGPVVIEMFSNVCWLRCNVKC